MASDALTTDELGQLLLDAAGAGDAEQVAKLLETGAPLSWCRPDGWTALMLAAEAGKSEVLSLLLDRGADANARGKVC